MGAAIEVFGTWGSISSRSLLTREIEKQLHRFIFPVEVMNL
jgi:hypothetical protein